MNNALALIVFMTGGDEDFQGHFLGREEDGEQIRKAILLINILSVGTSEDPHDLSALGPEWEDCKQDTTRNFYF